MAETSSELPNGLVSVSQASAATPNNFHNIMGVVTDVLPVAQSRGTDKTVKFELVDESSPYGLQVRYFSKTEKQLPKIGGTGDVVMLHGVKVTQFNGMPTGLSHFSTKWVVFPLDSIPEKAPKEALALKYRSSDVSPRPTPAHFLHAITLCNSRERSSYTRLVPPDATNVDDPATFVTKIPSIPSREKFSLVQDVQESGFYDLACQVIKTYDSGEGVFDLYVTDYTSHSSLYDYGAVGSTVDTTGRDGDEYGYLSRRRSKNDRNWPGPLGQMTLLVSLHLPHSTAAKAEVKEGHMVFLSNVRIRQSRNSSGRLEGVLHTDKRFLDRICIRVLRNNEDGRVQEVLKRKRRYEKANKKEISELMSTKKGKGKRTLHTSRRVLDKASGGGAGAGESSNKSRKRDSEEREDGTSGSNSAAIIKAAMATKSRELNKYVSCQKPAVRPLPLADILNGHHERTSPKGVSHILPFQNIRCRARVRVVDFFPPDLADFAVRERESEYELLSDSESEADIPESGSSTGVSSDEGEASSSNRPAVKWVWRFCLLLEDGHTAAGNAGNGDQSRIKVIVADADAEFLLRMTAEDLRKNTEALAKLRERLFVLWGDLEERKLTATRETAAAAASKPSHSKGANTDSSNTTTSGGKKAPSKGATGKVFECCLKEYGVPVRRSTTQRNRTGSADSGDDDDDDNNVFWERRYRMFGVTIQ